jgi:HEAT repeat protein
MTLAEHDALLEREGRYDEMQRRRREQDEELRRRAAEWRRAEAPLVEELREAGLAVESAWDLVNTSTPYPAALPILLEHLDRPYPDRVREGIARALGVRDARFAWDTLARLYRDEPAGTDAKHGLAVALAGASDDDVVDQLISLAKDETHGDSRLLLLRALVRSKTPQASTALQEFTEDPALSKEASSLLHVG